MISREHKAPKTIANQYQVKIETKMRENRKVFKKKNDGLENQPNPKNEKIIEKI